MPDSSNCPTWRCVSIQPVADGRLPKKVTLHVVKLVTEDESEQRTMEFTTEVPGRFYSGSLYHVKLIPAEEGPYA